MRANKTIRATMRTGGRAATAPKTRSGHPPILFLHGAFAGPDIWTRFVAPWFAQRGHQVSVPHLRGPASGARLRDYVKLAAAAADTLPAPPIVIGHSLGGLVAQHLAAQRPFAGVVLVSSPAPWGIGPSLYQLSARAPTVLAMLLATQAGARTRIGQEAIRRALFTDETPLSWVAKVSPTPDHDSTLALMDAMAWDLPAWYFARRAPMLAVLGDQDAFVLGHDLWAIRVAYGADTEMLRGFGHGIPIDPNWKTLVARIDSWIGKRRLRTADATRRLPAAG